MAKRQLEPELEVSEINSGVTSATVHGVLVELSPIKKGRRNNGVEYFEGKVSDGKEVRRLVSFEPSLWKEMGKMKDNGETVGFMNCQIKKSRYDEGYDLVVSKRSSIIASPKKYTLSDDVCQKVSSACELPKLSGIKDVAAHTGNKLSINGKVISVKVQNVKSKDRVLQMQECVVCDSSGSCRLVLWEELVGKVDCNKCYCISNVAVKAYGGKKYFSSIEMSKIIEVDDIGEVCGESIVVDDGRVFGW